jgi:hypothetical protein
MVKFSPIRVFGQEIRRDWPGRVYFCRFFAASRTLAQTPACKDRRQFQ